MAVVSETPQKLNEPQTFSGSLAQASAVNRTGRVFFGSVLLISALGLWLIPVSDGDSAMRLIKLAISLVMVVLGAMFISSLAEPNPSPEIMIDTSKRELRVIDGDYAAANKKEAVYRLDDLTAISLKDGEFSAHDENGEFLISIPVRDRQTQKALKTALDSLH